MDTCALTMCSLKASLDHFGVDESLTLFLRISGWPFMTEHTVQ